MRQLAVINAICDNPDSLRDVATKRGRPGPKPKAERQVWDPISRLMIDWVLEEAGRRGWSDSDLARRAGMTASVISEMQTGVKRGVTPRQWLCFVALFDFDMRSGFEELATFFDGLPDAQRQMLRREAAKYAPAVYVDDQKLAVRRKAKPKDDKPPSEPLPTNPRSK